MREFVQMSKVNAQCDEVWERTVTPQGINYELFPFMRMTVPKPLKGKKIHELPLGTTIGRSWFLLFGLMPFDYDDISIAELDHGRRFREKSSMLSIENWEHERTLVQESDGCQVQDRIRFSLRKPFSYIPGLESNIAKMLHSLFEHRHRRLDKWFSDHARS
jgi:ligand-binding SRPBCC domain-containing protein